MEMTDINFKIDAQLKEEFESACELMGMSMSVAFSIFAREVIRNQGIPFKIEYDPFCSSENMTYHKEVYKHLKEGTLKTEEHNLFEERK